MNTSTTGGSVARTPDDVLDLVKEHQICTNQCFCPFATEHGPIRIGFDGNLFLIKPFGSEIPIPGDREDVGQILADNGGILETTRLQ